MYLKHFETDFFFFSPPIYQEEAEWNKNTLHASY